MLVKMNFHICHWILERSLNKVFAVNNFLSYFNEYKLLTTVTGFQTQYLRYCILKSLRKMSSKNSQTGFLAHLLPIKLYLVILKKESAEMASTSTTRKHLNSVSIGNYEWIDNLKMDGVKRRICSSTLEIINNRAGPSRTCSGFLFEFWQFHLFRWRRWWFEGIEGILCGIEIRQRTTWQGHLVEVKHKWWF